jgi:dihydroorotate dehydrogenase
VASVRAAQMLRPYERLLRPALFRLGHGDPETAHEATLRALERVCGLPGARAALARLGPPAAPRTVFGVRFPNPVGLAAGLDKDARAVPAWGALGFGFAEVGTVTWHPQPGNPRPRLFRLPASEAVVNRMGFNNAGAEAMAARLRALGRPPVPLGISLGKSKITPVGEAPVDYLASLRVLLPYADYVAVNVSSPNTPGLRTLQDRPALLDLLATLREHVGGTPMLVKIAPDLTEPAIADVLDVCRERGVAGVIATNTTLARNGLAAADLTAGQEAGGLSGRPLTATALRTVGFVVSETGGELPVIGVGGIMSPDDAARMFDAGASLVQLYTGLIYRGPALVRGCVRAAAREAVRSGS